MNDRDGGSAEETPRTVADLLAQYGDGAVSSGGRRRRRATDPEETAPQSIIDRVLSDSGTMRRVDENGHPVPLPPSSGRPTGSHRPVVTPLPQPPPPPRPAGPAPGAGASLPSRGTARPTPPRMAPPNAGRPLDDLGHNSPAGDTGAHRYDTGSHRYDTGSHRPPGDNGVKPYGAPDSGPHRYKPSETGPHRYPPAPQSPQSDTGRYGSPTETGPHRYNPADTGAQRPIPGSLSGPGLIPGPIPADRGPGDRGLGDRGPGDRGPADRGPADRGPGDRGLGDRGLGDRGPGDRGLRPDDSRPMDLGRVGGRDALRRDPARREEDSTEKFPRIESVTLNPTGAPPAARPGRRGRHQPELDEPPFDPGPPRMPARPLAAPPMAPPVAPPVPQPPPSLSGPDVDRRFAGDVDRDDDLDDELDDDYDDEFDDEDDDDFDDDESPVREWLVMAGQLAVGAIGGAGLWLGFQWLWRAMPLVSLGVALVVITALVWVVRRIRRSDDLQTTVVTVLVGLFVTVSPAALLLVSR